MVIKNIKIVLEDRVIENGYLVFDNERIKEIGIGDYAGEAIDGKGQIAMPGFIDIHIHGSSGIDFMDASNVEEYKKIENSLYSEGVTTFLATTLTSDFDSLKRVCETVNRVKKDIPSLAGIHFEGPYISVEYKGAQNEKYIRNPDINEFDKLQEISGNNVRYITLAPEKEGALNFIEHVTKNGVTVSAGHTNALLADVGKAIKSGLTNLTHMHNAMSGHHHRKPGVVTAGFYFDELYTEFICDKIHICPDVLKMSYKVIGPERFIIITDSLKAKHSDLNEFELFNLPCEKRDGAAYLKSGPLAGSLLTMDQGIRNMYDITDASLVDLAKISSRNAAKSLHLTDSGAIQVGNLADIVLLDDKLNVKGTYKLGKKVY